MTNEMQYGVALAMLRNIVNGTGDDLKYLSQVVARVRAAYNILRSLKIANGGAQYEPDHNLCQAVPYPKASNEED